MYNPLKKEVKMRKIVSLLLLFVFFLCFYEFSPAKDKKTGEIKKDTLVDERFGYQLSVLSNWKINLEKEPSLVRSTLTKKNYQVNRSSTLFEEERLIPTIVICADTTSLSLPEIENNLIKGKGSFKDKDEYLRHLETIATYELSNSMDIVLDSVAGRAYGFKKSYTRQVVDPSQSYGPSGGDLITQEDYYIGEVVLLKKGDDLYIIQLTAEREYFAVIEKEFSRMLESWKFLR